MIPTCSAGKTTLEKLCFMFQKYLKIGKNLSLKTENWEKVPTNVSFWYNSCSIAKGRLTENRMAPAASGGIFLARNVNFVILLVLYRPYRAVPTRKKRHAWKQKWEKVPYKTPQLGNECLLNFMFWYTIWFCHTSSNKLALSYRIPCIYYSWLVRLKYITFVLRNKIDPGV